MIVAFSGHRQVKSSSAVRMAVRDFLISVHNAHRDLMVLSGGAVGFDTIVADCCVELGIPFTLVLPFPPDVMTAKWPRSSRDHLRSLMDEAFDVVVLSDHFSFAGYQVRNEHMVDQADLLCAYWDGSRGGTTNTVEYAHRKGVPVKNLWQ